MLTKFWGKPPHSDVGHLHYQAFHFWKRKLTQGNNIILETKDARAMFFILLTRCLDREEEVKEGSGQKIKKKKRYWLNWLELRRAFSDGWAQVIKKPGSFGTYFFCVREAQPELQEAEYLKSCYQRRQGESKVELGSRVHLLDVNRCCCLEP